MRQQRGFTLVEMIVALAVSALLVALAYGALRIGVRSWEATQTSVDRIDTLRVGWLAMHSALVEAVPVVDRFAETESLLFEGDEDRVTFTANMPSYLGIGGMYLVEIFVDEESEERPLRLRRTLYAEYRQRDLENNVQQADLAEQVKRLAIDYYGKYEDAPEPEWHQTWKEKKALPALVRIQVELENGERWPTLTAALRRGMDLSDMDTEQLDVAPEEADPKQPPPRAKQAAEPDQ